MKAARLEQTLRRWRADRMEFIGDLVLDDGRPLRDVLTGRQREMLAGIHRHPWSYIELSRGSGKTTLVAAEVTAELYLGKPGSRLYAAATDKDQAGLLGELVAGFIQRSAILARSAEIERWRIRIPSIGSRLDILSSDAPSSLGLIPDMILCDELTSWRDEALWHALWTAAGKRSAKMIVFSTPGDLGHFSKRVRDAAAEGGRWFYYARHQPPEWLSSDYLAEMRRTLPADIYARFFEARWVQGGGRPIMPDDLAAVFDPQLPRQTRGARGVAYAAALDVGLVNDRSVLAVVHQEASGTVVVDRLEVWEGTRDNRVLFADLAEALRRIHRDFNHLTIIIDPWQALNLVETLRAEGLRFEEAKFTSEYRHRIDANLFRLIKDRQLWCFAGTPESDLLADEMLNLEVELKPGGWRFNHRPGLHDDAWTAVAMAAAAVVVNPPTPPIDPAVARALQRARFYADAPGTDDWGTRSDAELLRPSSRRVNVDDVGDPTELAPRVRRHEGGVHTT